MGAESVELREVRVFLTLAAELHFGRTADRLYLTPSRVSQTVASLERRVGGRLFDRTSRRVALTDRGAWLRSHLEAPTAALQAAVDAAAAPRAGVHGELRLGLFGPAPGGPRLPEIIALFERRHPDARVQVVELALTDCYGPLRRGEVDLLASRVVVDAPDLARGPVLHVDDRMLVVATDHPLAGAYELSMEVLGDHPVARPVGWSAAMEEAVIPRRTPAGRPIVRAVDVASMTAVYTAVARGSIVHLAPSSTRFYSSHPGTVWIPVPDGPPTSSELVWRRDGRDEQQRAAVARFVDAARSVVDPAPSGVHPGRPGGEEGRRPVAATSVDRPAEPVAGVDRPDEPTAGVAERKAPIELHELRVFLTLAAELHFGRTAQRLHLTASRVSQVLATLEGHVGGRLFDRTSRRVALTDHGRELLGAVAGPYAELLTAVGGARAMDADLHGELRIGLLGPAAGGAELMAVSAEFERRHPGCTVRFDEIALSQGVAPLRRGEVDLLAGTVPSASPDLTVGPVVLRAEDRVLVVAPDHPLAGERQVSVEVLGDYTVSAVAGWPEEMQELVIPHVTPSGRPVVRSIEVHTMGTVWAAVARGEIVHLTTASMRHYSTHPGLVYVPVPDAAPLRYVLSWRTDNDDPRIRAFSELTDELRRPGPEQDGGARISAVET